MLQPSGLMEGARHYNKPLWDQRSPRQGCGAWLKKQVVWQIYLPVPWHIPRLTYRCDCAKRGPLGHPALSTLLQGWTCCKAMNVQVHSIVDVASSHWPQKKLNGLLTLSCIYKRSLDPGHELMGMVSQLLVKWGVDVRRGRVDVHLDQGILEHFNRTLAECLFAHQYAREMAVPGSISRKCVKQRPGIVPALNNKLTWLTG